MPRSHIARNVARAAATTAALPLLLAPSASAETGTWTVPLEAKVSPSPCWGSVRLYISSDEKYASASMPTGGCFYGNLTPAGTPVSRVTLKSPYGWFTDIRDLRSDPYNWKIGDAKYVIARSPLAGGDYQACAGIYDGMGKQLDYGCTPTKKV